MRQRLLACGPFEKYGDAEASPVVSYDQESLNFACVVSDGCRYEVGDNAHHIEREKFPTLMQLRATKIDG
jgi:hypothetical protein